MSIFKKQNPASAFVAIMPELEAAIKNNQADVTAASMRGLTTSMESLTSVDLKAASNSEEKAVEILKDTGFVAALCAHLGLEESHICVQNGIDAAATALIASFDAATYHSQFKAKDSKVPSDVTMMSSIFDGQDVSLEGYDAIDFSAFLTQSIVANGLTAAGSPLSETWFRTVVLTAGQNGVDIHLTDPRVHSRTQRKSTGREYELSQKSIVRAVIDATILENKHTKIIPVVDATFPAETFVPAAKVPNAEVTVMGEVVNTRPLAFGRHIDLVRISTPTKAVNGANLDHTDTLDAAINIGKVYVELTNGAGTPASGVVALDVAPLRGSLLNPQDEGSIHALAANFRGKVLLASDSVVVGGGTFEEKFGFADKLGLASTDLYFIEVEVEVTASADRVLATMRADFLGLNITGAYIGEAKAKADAAQVALVAGYLTASAGLGFFPEATKSDTNMRENGHILNMTSSVKARIPAIMQAPVSIISPVSGNATATMDGVAMYRRAINSNGAIKAIIKGAERLRATSGIVDGSAAIGALAGITPTYVPRVVDLSSAINQFGSSNSLRDLQGLLHANLTLLVCDMLDKSGYLASLELYTGTTTGNWEVIVATSNTLARLAILPDELRPFGAGVKFNIQSSNDSSLDNKFYVSVRRTDVTGADAHSFGVHPMMTSFIHKATVTRGGTSSETIVIPCENFAMTCPIIGEMTCLGLEGLFSI
jgi:hypothetical protein